MKIGFPLTREVFLAYIVKQYKEEDGVLGRTQIQKLCYFIKAKGVPLAFDFSMHYYGPFCPEIYDVMDSLILEGVVVDRIEDSELSNYAPGGEMDAYLDEHRNVLKPYKKDIDNVISILSGLDPTKLELLSTVHYVHKSYVDFWDKKPSKNKVVRKVMAIKGTKFSEPIIRKFYDILSDSDLLNWGIG